MAKYRNLINSIKAVIKQNGTNDITGQLMQDVLVAMTNSIGRFAAFAGTAMPSTNPNSPDQTVYYLTSIPGTYVNFGGIVVPPDRLVALHNISGSWEMVVVVTFSDGGTISIDPALDPNSVDPVENRAIYAEFQAIRSLIPTNTFVPQTFRTSSPGDINGFVFANKIILSFNASLTDGTNFFQYFSASQTGSRLNLCYANISTHSVSYEKLDGTTDFSTLLGNLSLVGNIEVIYAEIV